LFFSVVDSTPFTVTTESLDLEANAIAHRDGKVVFVRGALANETVSAVTVRTKPKFDVAQTLQVLKPSVQRVEPRCAHFGVCGGCSMQHLSFRSQVSVKQRTLEDNFWHLAKLKPETMLAPLVGEAWHYRYRARISVRDVLKKGQVLVGFHERNSSFVADMSMCPIMPARVSDMLVPLRRLVESLSIRRELPQIEMAYNDNPQDGQGDVLALALRIMKPLTPEDEAALIAFAQANKVEFWTQTKGPDTVVPFQGPSRLAYYLPEFDVRMPFKPCDFTQVNHRINEIMVRMALRLLAVKPHETVADLFCGLGNFTLPLARQARHVIGIEGSKPLVERARANAALNGLTEKTQFEAANLFNFDAAALEKLGRCDKWLVDPPREGAAALFQALVENPQWAPKRIVYVSCNPATLARDCGLLVTTGGWRLRSAGVINMFAHTSHVESVAVLEPPVIEHS
jgi:23S rRNA (uracil1939-C5)-methyltransferase